MLAALPAESYIEVEAAGFIVTVSVPSGGLLVLNGIVNVVMPVPLL